MGYPKLSYPPIHLRARRGEGGRTEIFDSVRKRWLVLTPEEWVRRHVVEYLITECRYRPEQIVEEYPVNINGMAVLIWVSHLSILLIVVCLLKGISKTFGNYSMKDLSFVMKV